MSDNNLSPTDQTVRELAEAVMDLQFVLGGGSTTMAHRCRVRLGAIIEDIDRRANLNPALVVEIWQGHAKALGQQLKDTEHQRDKALADLERAEHERDKALSRAEGAERQRAEYVTDMQTQLGIVCKERDHAVAQRNATQRALDKADNDFNKLANRVKGIEEERDALYEELNVAYQDLKAIENQLHAREREIDAARAAGANVMAEVSAEGPSEARANEAAVPAEEPDTWIVTRAGNHTATHYADTHNIDSEGMLTLYWRGDVVASYPRGEWVCLARVPG